MTDDPLADAPIRGTLTHEQALACLDLTRVCLPSGRATIPPDAGKNLSAEQLRELRIRADYAPHELTSGLLAWLDTLGEGHGSP